MGTPAEIGAQVKQAVFESSGVSCSVGVSGDKTTAKYAAKLQKPDGLTLIPPWQARDRLADIPLIELCGVNSGIAAMLAHYGVTRCADLQKLPISVLGKRLGDSWFRQHWRGQGIWQVRIVALNPAGARQADLFQRKHPRRERAHQAMDRINARYGAMTLASARLLSRSQAPDVISPAWKPQGHRNSL